MQMPGRTWTASDYRYSHNGQEKEPEVFSGANSAEYWMYDSRIGRRWNIDPVVDESVSPYAVFDNNPILMNDPDGLKPDWSYTRKHIGAILRHPFAKKTVRQHHKQGHHNRDKGDTKKHWSVGEVFMNFLGQFRGGSHYHLGLIPQGFWVNTQINPSSPDAEGTLSSGEHSAPLPITTPQGQYKRKVRQINILISNGDGDNGPPMGYLRVTGIYRHGSDRAKYRTMFTNSGFTGFGIGSGGNEDVGWGGGGHSGFFTSLPQNLFELARQFPNMFGSKDGGVPIALLPIAITDQLNNSVFSAFRNASAVRVENVFFIKPISYKLFIQYRDWNWAAPIGRKPLWKFLHDASGGGGKGFK